MPSEDEAIKQAHTRPIESPETQCIMFGSGQDYEDAKVEYLVMGGEFHKRHERCPTGHRKEVIAMFKKVDIDRLSSDKKYLDSLRYRGDIQIFWALSVFAIGLILLAISNAVSFLVVAVAALTFGSMLSCITNNAFRPFVIFADMWRMWVSGAKHVISAVRKKA